MLEDGLLGAGGLRFPGPTHRQGEPWLRFGKVYFGELERNSRGAPQGDVLSPALAQLGPRADMCFCC